MRSIASLDAESFLSFARRRASSARVRQCSGSLMKDWPVMPAPISCKFVTAEQENPTCNVTWLKDLPGVAKISQTAICGL
jgi:hypothetical protein